MFNAQAPRLMLIPTSITNPLTTVNAPVTVVILHGLAASCTLFPEILRKLNVFSIIAETHISSSFAWGFMEPANHSTG